MPRAILAAATFAMALAAATPALGLTCRGYPSAAVHLAETDLVFRGTVIAVVERTGRFEPETLTTFEINKVYKGTPRAQTVTVAQTLSSIGREYQVGMSDIVFAHEAEGNFWTSACEGPHFPWPDYLRALRSGAVHRGPRG